MVVAQSLALLLVDTAMLLAALTAAQLHNSPSLFNPPATPDREPHPLLRAQTDQEPGSVSIRYTVVILPCSTRACF